MKFKRLCRRLLLLGLAMIFCLSLSPAAFAVDTSDIRLALSVSEGTVSYRVMNDVEYKGAIVITAVYKNGRMVGCALDPLDIAPGVNDKNHFTAEFDDVQVMLVDAVSYAPLCKAFGYHRVTFLDYDGTVLSEQLVLPGQTAAPPDVSGREGYIFCGWDGGDYSGIYEDCSFTARYIADDSPNVFTVSSADGTVGEELVVSVALCGTVKLCGYNMNLLYDNSVLELVSVDSELSMDVLANPITNEGRVKFNFSARSDRTTGGDIMDITFRILKEDAQYTAITLKPVEVISIDPSDEMKFIDADFSVCEGGIRIK